MVTLYNSVDRYTAKKLTKEKRKFQTCKVYEVKVDRSHLSNETIKHLNNVFKESKFFIYRSKMVL